MEERGECACVHQQPGARPVEGAVHIEIETRANVYRHPGEAAVIQPRDAAANFRIDFQNETLRATIEDRVGRKQNVGPEDAIDRLFVHHLRRFRRAPEINRHHWFVDQVQETETQAPRHHHSIEAAVNLEACRDLGVRSRRRHPEMRESSERDRTNRCPGVDAQQCGFAVNECPHEEMILARALQRQRDKLQIARGGLFVRPERTALRAFRRTTRGGERGRSEREDEERGPRLPIKRNLSRG